MLERAAKAAYDEMIRRQWALFADTGYSGFLTGWETQPEKLKEDWRAAVMAALRVYGAPEPGKAAPFIWPGVDELGI